MRMLLLVDTLVNQLIIILSNFQENQDNAFGKIYNSKLVVTCILFGHRLVELLTVVVYDFIQV